jgi:hypothetical protein
MKRFLAILTLVTALSLGFYATTALADGGGGCYGGSCCKHWNQTNGGGQDCCKTDCHTGVPAAGVIGPIGVAGGAGLALVFFQIRRRRRAAEVSRS